ncbi:MAG: hypothetical protein QNK23_12785 [Crocinitomicaceae bacterium]|nr:hypothetical protein [Crocinitomicaceae bacterium]
MNSVFDSIEKYKYGIMAVTAVYVSIFMYLTMSSYEQPVYFEPFEEGAYVEIPENEIELTADNIQVPAEFGGDVTNVSRDAGDPRERSYDNFSTSLTQAQVEEQYRQLEEEMYDEAGGDKTRDEIRQEMENRRNHDLELAAQNENATQNNNPGQENVAAGAVMVEGKADGRNALHLPSPGYMTGFGSSGVVMVIVKLNVNGNVVTATYDASRSHAANQQMINFALEYAKKSRFSHSSDPSKVSGWISYRFVSQ